MHNLGGLLDGIKGNTHQAELKCLEFHAIWDIGIVYIRLFYKVEWFTQHQSIYLSRWLEFRKIQGICGISCMYSLMAFSNTNVVSFFGKKRTS